MNIGYKGALAVLPLLLSAAGQAQNKYNDVQIKDTPLRGSVHMLQGAGAISAYPPARMGY
nr:hypothetical protein [Salinimonas marina]